MKDFTFSDGTFIPEGGFVGTAVQAMQRDADFYENGDMFKPWRFSEAREREGDSQKHAKSRYGVVALSCLGVLASPEVSLYNHQTSS